MTKPRHRVRTGDRETVNSAKVLQQRLRDTLSLRADQPRSGGSGNSDDGNSARRAFKSPAGSPLPPESASSSSDDSALCCRQSAAQSLCLCQRIRVLPGDGPPLRQPVLVVSHATDSPPTSHPLGDRGKRVPASHKDDERGDSRGPSQGGPTLPVTPHPEGLSNSTIPHLFGRLLVTREPQQPDTRTVETATEMSGAYPIRIARAAGCAR